MRGDVANLSFLTFLAATCDIQVYEPLSDETSLGLRN